MQLKIFEKFRIKKCQKNYLKVLKRLQKEAKTRNLNVIFLVTENQKWGYQSLYEEFEKTKEFTTVIVVFPMSAVHKNIDKHHGNWYENYEFFQKRGMNVKLGYDATKHKYIDLKEFSPDIVFYEQPYVLPRKYKQYNVSKFALTCYCHYGIAGNSNVMKKNYKFYNSLWKFFTAHECLKKEYSSFIVYPEIVVSGHPKLDVYREFNEQQNSDGYVIYAPHFSTGKSLLHFSTFDWSGDFMLDFAFKHPEIKWIFKPHPNLKSHFINSGYKSKSEVDEYFDKWAMIGTVYTEGDYFDIFKSSRAMITDCGSFLTEYSLTGKSLLHLVSENSLPQSSLNALVASNYYKIYSQYALECHLQEIIIKENDFMKEKRVEQINKIFANQTFNSAKYIVNYLNKMLEGA